MCSPDAATGLSRRRFLLLCGLATVAGTAPLKGLTTPAAASDGVPIGEGHLVQPRDTWGKNLQPTGPMSLEAPEDVRFLLVHHSASPNNYSAEQSIQYLRSFYRYHTSAEKGWPDIAYNFLVDRYGQIFEGRAGSIESPVRGDATGGSQGYALLCCFIGDHTNTAPTPEARSAMVALLAWLAATYNIDPSPGATTEFVSRGSNLHPEGKLVTTPTITGHRTMSRTTCPGDQAFDLVQNSFPAQVRDRLTPPSTMSTQAPAEPAAAVTTSATPTSATTTAPTTTQVASTTQAPAQPAPHNTRQPAAPDTTTATTTTRQVASSTPTTSQPATAKPHPPPTSTLPAREPAPERHSIQSVESAESDSQQDSLLDYWPFAAMSLGLSTLIALNIIQRRIVNQRPPSQKKPPSVEP